MKLRNFPCVGTTASYGYFDCSTSSWDLGILFLSAIGKKSLSINLDLEYFERSSRYISYSKRQEFYPVLWIRIRIQLRSNRHHFAGSGYVSVSAKCKGKLNLLIENFRMLSKILKIMTHDTDEKDKRKIKQCKLALL